MSALNLFKYLGEIPEFVYISNINKMALNEINKSIYQLAWEENGTAINYREILTLEPVSKYKNIALETKKVNFHKISNNHQEKLISFMLKSKYKILNKLNKELNENFRPKINSDLIIERYLKNISAYKIDKDFYIALKFKHKIYTKKSLYDFYKFNKKSLERIINKPVKTKPKDAIGKVVEIIYPDTAEHLKEKEGIIKHYRNTNQSILESIKDLNQPIFLVELSKGNTLPYFSQFLYPIISIDKLSEEEIYYLRLDNKEKGKIISQAIINSKLDKILSPTPLKIKGITLQKPVRKGFIKIGNKLKRTELEKVSNILRKVQDDSIARTIFPIKVPSILKNKEIPIFIFLDKELENLVKKSKQKLIKELILALNAFSKKDYFPNFKVKSHKVLPLKDIKQVLGILNQYNGKSDIPPLVITVGSEKHIKSNEDYYEDLKRRLFSHSYITQNVIYEHLKKATNTNMNINYELNALVFQILSKYGMYPYVLEDNFEYDFIIGVDVGNDEYDSRTIAGALSIINKKGVLESLIPLKISAKGEKVKYHYFLEKLISLKKFELENKKVLILKDGLIYSDEIKTLYENFPNYNFREITLMNVKKNNDFFFVEPDCEGKAAFINDETVIIQPHKHSAAQPLKIDNKIKIDSNGYVKQNISIDDLNLLYKLSHLNYSTLLPEVLRLPAPLHYAHKLIGAMRKYWEIDDIYALEGFLYFI